MWVAPALHARTCSGNGEVVGSYGYFGSRESFFLLGATAPGSSLTAGPLIPVPLQPPGSTGATTPVVGSNTPWGRFFAGLANTNAFEGAGRVFADGAGSLYSSDVAGGLITNNVVGTYTVSSDCSVTMTLRDISTPSAIVTTTGPTVTLEGELVDGRIEAVVTGPNSTGAIVTFVKSSQFNGCTNSSLSGSFGLLGTGMATSSTTGTGVSTGTGSAFAFGAPGTLGVAFTILGRLIPDGSGHFFTETGSQTPLKRTLTGSYTVNVDCTGTAQLNDASGSTRNITFVLINDSTPVGGNVVITGAPSFRFVFTDPGVIGGGTATQQ